MLFVLLYNLFTALWINHLVSKITKDPQLGSVPSDPISIDCRINSLVPPMRKKVPIGQIPHFFYKISVKPIKVTILPGWITAPLLPCPPLPMIAIWSSNWQRQFERCKGLCKELIKRLMGWGKVSESHSYLQGQRFRVSLFPSLKLLSYGEVNKWEAKTLNITILFFNNKHPRGTRLCPCLKVHIKKTPSLGKVDGLRQSLRVSLLLVGVEAPSPLFLFLKLFSYIDVDEWGAKALIITLHVADKKGLGCNYAQTAGVILVKALSFKVDGLRQGLWVSLMLARDNGSDSHSP